MASRSISRTVRFLAVILAAAINVGAEERSRVAPNPGESPTEVAVQSLNLVIFAWFNRVAELRILVL